MAMTITEALADLKTIGKRIAKKESLVQTLLTRVDGLKDPMEKQGGSVTIIQNELQGISDLESRHLSIRMAIQKSNQVTEITIMGVTRTVAEWLTWRKEIYPNLNNRLLQNGRLITNARIQASRTGGQVVPAGQENTKPQDVVVNVDEKKMAQIAEDLETMIGTLDGQLSLRNATTTIDV